MGILSEMYNKFKEDNNLTFQSDNNIINLIKENFKIIVDCIPYKFMDSFISLLNDIRLDERSKLDQEKEFLLEFGVKIGIRSQKK